MSSSDYMGCRLNKTEDSDIIADLNKYSDKTKRLKDVYRKIMSIEAQAFSVQNEAVAATIQHRTPQIVEEPKKTIVWNFPKEPTVKDAVVTPIPDKPSVRANILSNDF